MNKAKLNKALAQIEKAKKSGFYMEALLMQYHINLEILNEISYVFNKQHREETKPKALINFLLKENGIGINTSSVISKKTLKVIKVWMVKMDQQLKSLRIKSIRNPRSLLLEAEKIFVLLNMSSHRLKAQSVAE